ncbi:MAG TPA: hypothetical protein VLJ21_00345, partial [Candidatus Binatia bacterium]|nr:hypothetical protein [Candidatus Binatia bacterium]
MIEDIGSVIANFAAGVATPLFVLGSPTEWAVHRYLLHPETRNCLNRGSARGHNDLHHGAYNGPAHYYRDVTNEHEVIHFSPGDVSVIAAGGAVIGTALDRARAFVDKQPFGERNIAFIAGALAGTMAYYVAYEFTHHYMHVIGQRRHAINHELGRFIQGEPDGNLRFSKPLLDDICNHVERYADQNAGRAYPAAGDAPEALTSRLEQQLAYNQSELHDNRCAKANITVSPKDAPHLLA